MKCKDIANLLDEGELPRLPAEWLEDVKTHLAGCESCANEWRAVQALRSWRDLPTPSARPELFAETMRRATQPGVTRDRRNAFLSGFGIGGALAAGIAIAVIALNPAIQEAANSAVPALAIALNEPHDVSVAIDSSEALMGAQIRVVLTGGIQLAGLGDQSVLSWRTDLDRGANRLTLPVIAVRPDGGQVIVEVAHERTRQIFVVNVDVDATVSTAPSVVDRPELASNTRIVPASEDEPTFVKFVEPPRRFAV